MSSQHKVAPIRVRLNARFALLLGEEDLDGGRANVTQQLHRLGEDPAVGLVPGTVLGEGGREGGGERGKEQINISVLLLIETEGGKRRSDGRKEGGREGRKDITYLQHKRLPVRAIRSTFAGQRTNPHVVSSLLQHLPHL
jgi:hypothetical protein